MARKFDTVLDRARDELFSHIHRCGVLEASDEQQGEWIDETIEFMGERYPDLSQKQLTQLKDMGLRFLRPVIPHGRTDEEAVAAGEEAVPAEEGAA